MTGETERNDVARLQTRSSPPNEPIFALFGHLDGHPSVGSSAYCTLTELQRCLREGELARRTSEAWRPETRPLVHRGALRRQLLKVTRHAG